jgi:hypothetical protein
MRMAQLSLSNQMKTCVSCFFFGIKEKEREVLSRNLKVICYQKDLMEDNN